jgi:hypothetical protein
VSRAPGSCRFFDGQPGIRHTTPLPGYCPKNRAGTGLGICPLPFCIWICEYTERRAQYFSKETYRASLCRTQLSPLVS